MTLSLAFTSIAQLAQSAQPPIRISLGKDGSQRGPSQTSHAIRSSRHDTASEACHGRLLMQSYPQQ